MTVLLVDSPAVGPSTWRWVAAAVESRGHEVIVPNLVAAARSGDPAAFARAAAAAVDTAMDVVVVGHSAAGSLLPVVAGLTPHVRRLVFVDASVPPCEGTCTAAGDFLVALQGLAEDGMLPAWSHWWGEGVLQALVRDEARRLDIEGELVPIPLAFFDTPVAMPAGWCDGDGAFLLLSEFYRSDAGRAEALGWPVLERPGGHLDKANDDEVIADLLVAVVDR